MRLYPLIMCIILHEGLEMERNSRKLIRLVEQAGWRLIEVRGDHHHFRHPSIKEGDDPTPKQGHRRQDRAFYLSTGWLDQVKEHALRCLHS